MSDNEEIEDIEVVVKTPIKPKKKRVMTEEMLANLALARQKCKEKRESQAGVISTAKSLKEKERELRALRLQEKKDKLAQIEAEIEKKSKRYSASKEQEEEDQIEDLEKEIVKKSVVKKQVVVESEDEEVAPVVIKKKKAKKPIIYESDSSDSEGEIVLTKKQLKKLMSKSNKPVKEVEKPQPVYNHDFVDYSELFAHRNNF